jgi:competence ComEA-like helix-hairpin-helix protein
MDVAPKTTMPPEPAPPATGTAVTAQPPTMLPAPPPAAADAGPFLNVPAMPPPSSVVLDAWPRPALWAIGLLLVLAATFLGMHFIASLRRGARPTDLEHGLDYRVDLNGANKAELLQLPGVGDNMAQRILDYRRARGGFRRVDDLLELHGVGDALLNRLRPWVWVGRDDEDDDPAAPPANGQHRRGGGKEAGRKFVGRQVLSKKAAALKGPIDINTASAAELQKLPWIGEKRAQHIVAERRNGRFKSPEDLGKRVSGIGPRILADIRPHIRVGPPPDRIVKAD